MFLNQLQELIQAVQGPPHPSMWINEKSEQQNSTGQHHSMTMDMPMMGSDAGGEVGCKAAKEV